ncbi:uncharacterized protein EV154DRAFT_477211 [Mucor mucedo]|uniref:uncharacterized protein n=1 Tax=Mucor mucedo TaxID=29922 RepID=UPI00221E9A42|nr:uncharacterized protein EV154DRAFT_477211 [Mucor mucedo]KAI7895760.1 hypothetical protein EV154DRAFT_477211 [Mucor mucedo]
MMSKCFVFMSNRLCFLGAFLYQALLRRVTDPSSYQLRDIFQAQVVSKKSSESKIFWKHGYQDFIGGNVDQFQDPAFPCENTTINVDDVDEQRQHDIRREVFHLVKSKRLIQALADFRNWLLEVTFQYRVAIGLTDEHNIRQSKEML